MEYIFTSPLYGFWYAVWFYKFRNVTDEVHFSLNQFILFVDSFLYKFVFVAY